MLALCLVLVLVAFTSLRDKWRSTSWRESLQVAVFPIAADGSAVTADYVANLRAESFGAVESFFAQEAARYRVGLENPVSVSLGKRLTERPPAPPAGGNAAQAVLWSLQMRFWALGHGEVTGGPPPQVRLYLLFHDPARSPRLAHSLGLEKGLLGVVQVFATATQEAQNNVVIAHELLHTLGATDKYDPRTGFPLYPDGYAESAREPRFPQEFAELMGGRIPLSAVQAAIPEGLQQVLVGYRTAQEIRWTD